MPFILFFIFKKKETKNLKEKGWLPFVGCLATPMWLDWGWRATPNGLGVAKTTPKPFGGG
jgi:hypothetical protein